LAAFFCLFLGCGHGLNDKKDELSLFREDVAAMHPAFPILTFFVVLLQQNLPLDFFDKLLF